MELFRFKLPVMSQAVDPHRDRISRRQADKFAQRRAQLAESALQTLAELGYARTSLREIAQNSEFSHGVLHYYFADKVDLLTHCVRRFEEVCVTRYDEIVARARTAAELERDFAAAMAATLRADAKMHRLWYDLRHQSPGRASASSTRRWCTSRASATPSCSARRRGGSPTSRTTGSSW